MSSLKGMNFSKKYLFQNGILPNGELLMSPRLNYVNILCISKYKTLHLYNRRDLYCQHISWKNYLQPLISRLNEGLNLELKKKTLSQYFATITKHFDKLEVPRNLS